MRKRKKKVFSFCEQQTIGDKGEAAFLKFYADRNPRKSTEDLAFDFFIDKENKKVELKSDNYSLEDTPNFFMERYSDNKTKKLGGVWRSVSDNVDFFVYYYLKDKVFYWFEPKTLCKFLDEYIEGQSYISVRNPGYCTVGYKIPRQDCENLCLRIDKV